MSKGGGTTTSETKLPAWLEDAAKENIARVDELSARPYVPYTGDLVAGQNADQTSAYDAIRGNVGAGQGALSTATGAAGGVAGFDAPMIDSAAVGADVANYMNPFQQFVTDDIMRSGQVMQQGNAAAASKAGAFGGSRQGVVESETNRGTLDEIGKASASGFDRALAAALGTATSNQGAALQGAGLNLQGANSLAGMAQQQQKMGLLDATALQAGGDAQQAQQQKGLDSAYAQWLKEQGYDQEMLNMRISATGATPHGQTQTQQQPEQSMMGALPMLLAML